MFCVACPSKDQARLFLIDMRNIPDEALKIIRLFEGCRLKTYDDCVGIATIGFGHVLPKGLSITSITQEEADNFLHQDAQRSALSILSMTKAELTDNQFAALISFVFNVGTGAYQRSTLRQKLNRGDYQEAADQFLKWCKAGGKIIPGLLKRRKLERELFLKIG